MATKSPASGVANRAVAAYFRQLKTNELRTKAITAGVLNFISEIVARHLAGVPSDKRASKQASLWTRLVVASKVNDKAFMMGLYGMLVSAPLSHYLASTMQKVFVGRQGKGVKLLMIGTSLLVVAPLQIAVFLASLAVIDGARTQQAVWKTVKAAFVPVFGITLMLFPPSIAFARAMFPPEFEGPFMNLVQFANGTFFKTKALIAREQAKKADKDKPKKE